MTTDPKAPSAASARRSPEDEVPMVEAGEIEDVAVASPGAAGQALNPVTGPVTSPATGLVAGAGAATVAPGVVSVSPVVSIPGGGLPAAVATDASSAARAALPTASPSAAALLGDLDSILAKAIPARPARRVTPLVSPPREAPLEPPLVEPDEPKTDPEARAPTPVPERQERTDPSIEPNTDPELVAAAASTGHSAWPSEDDRRERTSPAIVIPGLAERAAKAAVRVGPAPAVTPAAPGAGAPIAMDRAPRLTGSVSEWNPQPEGRGAVDEADESREPDGDTVILDPEMQDRLMALRAAQDHVLRTHYGGDVVVMFSDLVGSTAYYERHGDLMGRQKLLTHNALLFPIIRAHDGTVVKTIGDGIMACFGAPPAALTCAGEMQRALRRHNVNCSDPEDEIHIRIGINAGPAIAEDGDLHGDAVNVASRIQAAAAAGDVLVSHSALVTAGTLELESLGEMVFKGKADPIGVYRLRWDADESGGRPIESRVIATRYRLHEEIGRGPVGVVYAGHDVRLRVPVAIKLLHPFVLDSETAAQRFASRVQTMASLMHDGIVRVLDASPAHTEEPFYVSDRIDGPDLALWVTRNGCPEPRRAARIVRELAEAVAFAHRRGVLHGNIKPENVIMGPQNRAKLSDFGVGDIARVTHPGSLIASPAYRAPEQVTDGRADARTDVYGLGALLYFLLAGRAPHETTASLKAMRAVASGLYVKLRRLRPDLGEPLLAFSERALAASPRERTPTVEAFLNELHAFCDPPGLHAVEVPPSPLGEPAATPPEDETDETTFVGLSPKRGEARPPLAASAAQEADASAPETTFVGRVTLPEPTPTDWTQDPRTLWRALTATGVVALAAFIALLLSLTADPPPAASPGVTPAARLAGGVARPGATEGMLVLDATAGAEVRINDQVIGRTPEVRSVWLTAGQHRLSLRRSGSRAHEEIVTVAPGQVLTRRIQLSAAP